MTDSSLTYHEFDDCLWVRCTSRGSFVNSPALKAIAEKYIAKNGQLIVVDLEICPGVDSTFMGTLAGLARKMMTQGGFLQIATPGHTGRACAQDDDTRRFSPDRHADPAHPGFHGKSGAGYAAGY